MSRVKMLRVELHRYTDAIRESGERMGRALEANRRRWPWESNEPMRSELYVAWQEYAGACEGLYEAVNAPEGKELP